MKALTIKQPWATLIMQGDKRFEFRSWQTKYRGELLIHAGKRIDKEAIKRLSKYLPKELPLGEILGKVTLVDCVKMSPKFKKMLLKENKDIYTDSSFKENYGWQLENVEVFKEPLEAKGRLSLWEYEMQKAHNFFENSWIDIICDRLSKKDSNEILDFIEEKMKNRVKPDCSKERLRKLSDQLEEEYRKIKDVK